MQQQKGNWNTHQKLILDEIAKKLNVQRPSDWGNISNQQIKDVGGSSILRQFGDSLRSTLRIVYPDINWRSEWFDSSQNQENQKNFLFDFASKHQIEQKPEITKEWKKTKKSNNKLNHRKLLDEIAKKLNIKTPSDWGKITIHQIKENGGNSMLSKYNGSLFQTLKEVYEETEWNLEWFEYRPQGYWKDVQNRRTFMENFARKNGISKPSDWGKITIQKIKESGGNTLLTLYNNSLIKTLETVFPEEIQWQLEWFHAVPHGYWKDPQNQRNFLEKLSKKLNIKNPSDWGKVTSQQIKENGGNSLLRMGTLFSALKKSYTEIQWNKEWFVHLLRYENGYWKNAKNQRNFLESLAKKLHIKQPSDWGKITTKVLRHYGAYSLLSVDSFFNILKKAFPETHWKLEWFPNIPRFEKGHWEKLENQRNFLDHFANMYNLHSPDSWKKVTSGLFRSKGGKGLLKQYKGSIINTLQGAYGGENWILLSEINSQLQRSKPQKYLEKFLKISMPDEKIYLNFRHPELNSPLSRRNVELDIWIPRFNLAFEYHGEQHFRETFNQSLSVQNTRDNTRRIECERMKITLLEIPYWWDEEEESLLATLLQARPDLEPFIQSPLLKDPIKRNRILKDPEIAIPKSNYFKDTELMMLSTNWNPNIDPKGWFIMEKLDGIRGYWNGKNMYSKSGKLISIPSKLRELLPSDNCLDGEFWHGRLGYPKCRRSVMIGDFDPIAYQLFDVPNMKKTYSERLRYLCKFSNINPNIEVPSVVVCEGKDHLMKILEETLDKGGEGLILRNPNAFYEMGRSVNSLKVKPTYVEKVRVCTIERLEQTEEDEFKYFHVEVENKFGRKYRLNTRTSQLKFPDISVNSVLTIGFSSLNINGVPKFSLVLEHHREIKWENIIPFSIDFGKPFRKSRCEGCKKELTEKLPRFQVKGIHWLKKNIGYEPTFRYYSACVNSRCIEEGLESLKEAGVEIPRFEGKIFLVGNQDCLLQQSGGLNSHEIVYHNYLSEENLYIIRG